MINLAIHLLNTEECCTLSERLLSIFKTDLPKDSAVKKVLPFLEKLDDDLKAIMAKISNTEDTENIAEKDKARDIAFILFRDYCKAFTNMPDPAQAAAAAKLADLIRKLGWTLYTEGYTEQTALLNGLFEALEEPEYTGAAVTIKAESLVANLKSAHAAFEAAVALKAQTRASQNDIPLIGGCKQRMGRYLKPLLYYIELMTDVDPKNFANANAKITEVTEAIMTVARARETRRINQQAEG